MHYQLKSHRDYSWHNQDGNMRNLDLNGCKIHLLRDPPSVTFYRAAIVPPEEL